MTKPTTEELKDLLGKVTQGEWVADGLNKSGLPSAYINASDGYPVARAVGVVSEFETEANASLIALAPTLAVEVVRLREVLACAIDTMLFAQAEIKAQAHIPHEDEEMMNDRIERARQALSQK